MPSPVPSSVRCPTWRRCERVLALRRAHQARRKPEGVGSRAAAVIPLPVLRAAASPFRKLRAPLVCDTLPASFPILT